MTVRMSPRYLPLSSAALVTTVAAFVVPALLLSIHGVTGQAALVAASESAFVHTDLGGRATDSEALAELTARWREFHVVKAAVALLLVLVLARLASDMRRTVEAAGHDRRRWPLLAGYAGVVLWLLGGLTVLLANVQGAAAPLASVASLLPTGHGSGALEPVLGGLRRALQAETPPPVAGVAGDLLGDFTVYHAVLAVLAAAAGTTLTTLSLRAMSGRWRLRGSDEPLRLTLAARATLYGAAGGCFLLLALANTSTWIDPVPALVASLGGR